jgi:hypothetical protein
MPACLQDTGFYSLCDPRSMERKYRWSTLSSTLPCSPQMLPSVTWSLSSSLESPNGGLLVGVHAGNVKSPERVVSKANNVHAVDHWTQGNRCSSKAPRQYLLLQGSYNVLVQVTGC